jgi:hypothetical protein
MHDNRTLDQILYAQGTTLPKGWRWGVYFCVRGGPCGYYAIRGSDGYCVMVADSPEYDAPSPAMVIRKAIADGVIPRVRRRCRAKAQE